MPQVTAVPSILTSPKIRTLYPYQEAFLTDFSRYRIVNKARQVGFTTAIQIDALLKAMLSFRSTILIVSVSERQAKKVLAGIMEIIQDNGIELTHPTTKTQVTLAATQSQIVCLPNNPRTVRGYTAQAVYLDEFAHFEAGSDVAMLEAIQPSTSHGGSLTIVSTPFGRKGEFYRIWTEEKHWSKHRVPWYLCPRFDQAWYEETRKQYSDSAFAQEFETSFVDSGKPVFRESVIQEAFEGAVGLQPPELGHKYITGWDFGQKQDWTVGTTIDVTEEPWQLVAFDRFQRTGWEFTRAQVFTRYALYGGDVVLDVTGVGDPVYEDLCAAWREQYPGEREPFIPYQISDQKKKYALIEGLVIALERKQLKIPEVPETEPLIRELRYYTLHDRNLVTDCVFSLALAVWAARQRSIAVARPRRLLVKVV